MQRIAISVAIVLGGGFVLGACSKGEDAGREAAKAEAEAEDKAKAKVHAPAKVQRPPVPGETKIPCSQIIDAAAFQQALGEKEPLTVKSKGDPNATRRAAWSAAASDRARCSRRRSSRSRAASASCRETRSAT
jgi:hypothetical protein